MLRMLSIITSAVESVHNTTATGAVCTAVTLNVVLAPTCQVALTAKLILQAQQYNVRFLQATAGAWEAMLLTCMLIQAL